MSASLGAAAEDDGADGTSRLGIGNRKVAATGFFVDGHSRNERDAHSCAYHAEQTGKLTAFKNDLRMDACAVARSDGIFAETVAVAEKEEWFLANVFQRDGATAGQFVFLREHGEERLGEEREGFEFVAANRKGEDGDVDYAGAEAVEKHGSDFFDHGEPHLRKFFRKGGEDAREEIRSDGGNGADRHRTADGILLFDDIAARGFEFTQNSTGAGQKCFADFGEADGAAETVEEAGAEFVFEF